MIKDVRELKNPLFELNEEVGLLNKEVSELRNQMPTKDQFQDGLTMMKLINSELRKANEINEALLELKRNTQQGEQ